MAANIGQTITASVYNSIRSKVSRILGTTGTGNRGYGIPLESTTKVDNDLIRAADMDALYNDLVKARQHQVGVPVTWTLAADGLDAPDAGELIGVYASDVGPDAGDTSADATVDTDEGFLDFENAAADIENDRLLVGAGQAEITTPISVRRTSPWNGTLTFGFSITWTNAEERRFWFNSGGYITIASRLSGGTSISGDETNTPPATKDEIWQTMLNTGGTYKLSVTGSEVISGSATTNPDVSGIYSDINTETDWSAYTNDNRLLIFQKAGSGVYSENLFKIEAWQTATNTIRFALTYEDNDIGDDTTPGDGFDFKTDENVTGNISCVVQVRTATGLGKQAPTATITDAF